MKKGSCGIKRENIIANYIMVEIFHVHHMGPNIIMEKNVIMWNKTLLSNIVIIWDEKLSFGLKSYQVVAYFIIWIQFYHVALNVII